MKKDNKNDQKLSFYNDFIKIKNVKKIPDEKGCYILRIIDGVKIHPKYRFEKNILSILEIQNYTRNKKNQRLDELLNEFNLSKIRNSYGATLSGGERRRTEIARALASNPNYILLDEPLAGIDPIAINDLKNLIQQLKNKNIGVLITDHNVRETLGIVDKAYILYDGSVIMFGSPEEIKADERVREVYLGNNF